MLLMLCRDVVVVVNNLLLHVFPTLNRLHGSPWIIGKASIVIIFPLIMASVLWMTTVLMITRGLTPGSGISCRMMMSRDIGDGLRVNGSCRSCIWRLLSGFCKIVIGVGLSRHDGRASTAAHVGGCQRRGR